MFHIQDHIRFNPRPPSLTGEHLKPENFYITNPFQSTPAIADGRTPAGGGGGCVSPVSIHARHR